MTSPQQRKARITALFRFIGWVWRALRSSAPNQQPKKDRK